MTDRTERHIQYRGGMLLLSAACLLVGTVGTASERDSDQLFTLKVLPLLKEKCVGCHATDADDLKGDFAVDSREALLKGGESGDPSIVPGKPDESILYQAVMWDGYEMPPKENDRLTKEQTEYVRRWIEAGAPWPDAKRQDEIRKAEWAVRENEDGVIVDTSGGLADEWTYRRYQPEDIWAFRAVRQKAELGGPQDDSHPVDFFVNTNLQKAKLPAAKSADARTLIRRVTYDLTGLPPTPRAIFDFRKGFKAAPEQAYGDLIDRLLASDHYGERWGQHWLDVVRYADTGGFSNDYERSNAWRYRDYVIRSFNNDKPFNDFVVEQIAGDELRPDDPEATIATSFLRMGPWGTAMIPQDEARQIYLNDLVHNTGQSFLSMPMRCCKCHDHKFDPIPTRDYYRLYAAFAATQPAEVPADFLPEENRSGVAKKKKLVEELLAFAKTEQKTVSDKMEAAAREWYKEHDLPYRNANQRKNDPEDKKPPRHVGLTPEETGIKKVREQDVWIWERRLERYQPLAQGVYDGSDRNTNARKLRPANSVQKGWKPATFILAGGSLEAKLAEVGPGVLSGIGLPAPDENGTVNAESPPDESPNTETTSDDPYLISDGLSGRRLQLARWIASDSNSLTARSFVNRVWQYHFGTGIVKTPNNFGAKGGKPTHPDLLDWLTADFIENGWKTKRLHRLIMTSAAYRRSGQHPNLKKIETIDPNNDLLARFPARRLTAEEFRDSTLLISGELNREMGGVPIMPEINMEVALQPRMIQFSIAPAHQPSRTPAERNRRTIYAYRVRGQADPMLEILNLPNPNESCDLRDTAAVTPQAFTLMNSDTITDRSIAFALRVQQERTDNAERVRRAVQLAYGRVATAQEEQNLTAYLAEMAAYHQQHKPTVVEYPTQVTRSLVEEFTGQPFQFIELLNVYNDYVPDAKPWTVSAETRALADVCLLLLNSNEFMYVY
ncbi:MAG: PSD1 and planctomycete cytochrome C domain-containing protein [Fuerstiella sp.]|nr:PSD1 and planctomycete cytochrome C domain-containing protein [Fuerstiella sp.]